jgi:hypothetical protein
MLPQNLPSLERTVSTGAALRFASSDAISYVEVAAQRADSGKVTAAKLRDFFIACANAADKAAGGAGDVGKPAPT